MLKITQNAEKPAKNIKRSQECFKREKRRQKC